VRNLRTGPGLRQITLERDDVVDRDEYPFVIPVIASFTSLEIRSRVLCFVGENGSGKSTLLEAIAVACGFAMQGGSRNFRMSSAAERDDSLYDESKPIGRLADALRLRWTKRQRDGFFLRTESFYNAASYVESLARDDIRALDSYGGVSLHKRSHGESFLTLFLERFGGGGLYLLDEPEAALSAPRQLAMLARMHDLLADEPWTQFIIATHSPILLAFPDAQIVSFDGGQMRPVRYQDTDAYVVTRRFLENPARGLRELFEE
jgi:predicted ATPase